MRKHYIITLLLFLSIAGFSQQGSRTLSGKISGADGVPIENVTVTAKNAGRSYSEVTNKAGVFRFTGLPDGNYSLEITHVGYATYTRNITLNSDQNLEVNMATSDESLDEVVVTALGIKREQKALGYAAQSISGESVTDARSNNWSSALSGKVAGLNLTSAGSGPLSTTRINLRGDASLNPDNNNALIVIDGVPVNNKAVSSGVGNAYGAGSGSDVPIDFGNGISDLNPDDIESITVLKGPGASALYGSRAGNGAILITTKSGSRKGKGIGVTVNTNVSMNDILRWPDYQYEYGQGTGSAYNAAGEKFYSYGVSPDGSNTGGTSSAYGPKFEGQSYFQYDPTLEGQSAERQLWRPYENNIKDFWRTGYTLTNNVALEGGNDKGSSRLSLTHTKNEWIMPNTGFERLTVALNNSYQISPKLKVSSRINYTNKKSDNLPATGYNNQSIAYFMIFQNPNVDLNWYRPIWKKGMEQIDQIHPFSSFIDNPFLIAYEMTNGVNSNAVVGNVMAHYSFTPDLELMVRAGIDMSGELRQQRRPYSSANYQRGYYKEQNINFQETNIDFLLTYKKDIGTVHRVSASAGGNTMNRKFSQVDGTVEDLIIPGVFKLNNGVSIPLMYNADQNKKVNSLYGMITYGWKDMVFVDVTARNDWSSTLPVQNNSYFYPSINTSLILSDILSLPQPVSFAKLRFSVAQGGNDSRAYMTRKYYGASDFPGSGSVPTVLFNPNFKPEISNSYEAGLDMRFFNSRLSFDLTFYRNITENQILEVPVDPTTGYSRALLNAGKVQNQGVELVLSGQPVKTQNFTWNSTITWSTNDNKVLELAEGMEDKQDIGYGGNATLQARVGGSTGDIYGFGFLRAPDGQIIYRTNGLPDRPTEIQYIGNAYAQWKGGFLNSFNYRSIRLSVLVDGQYGGIIYSQSHHKMMEQGKLKATLFGREEDFIIGDGVVDDGSGTFKPNTVKVRPHQYYSDYYRRANVESNSFDASFVKLREVRIEYSIPSRVLSKTFIQGASIALYGRDLALISDFPVFDPETASLNGSSILPGVEMGQLPTPRTFGANLTLRF